MPQLGQTTPPGQLAKMAVLRRGGGVASCSVSDIVR